MNENIFLDIRNLTKGFSLPSAISRDSLKKIKAVDNVSFKIFNSESFGLVGETGSGKSTLGRCLLRLIEADQGQILHDNLNLAELAIHNYRSYRLKFQMIFQNPGLSLNPVHTIRRALSEPVRTLKLLPASAIPARLDELLNAVGLEEYILDYLPHQLSGGQKQRVVIARVLALNPSFIIADEPTSSVDTNNKRQIMDLIKNIRHQFGLTLMLISHDLSIIDYATDRTAVMFKGSLVEIAPTKILMENPAHPYTRQLIESSRLRLNIKAYSKKLQRESADPFNKGCNYVNECPWAKELCNSNKPELQKLEEKRFVACHFPEEIEKMS